MHRHRILSADCMEAALEMSPIGDTHALRVSGGGRIRLGSIGGQSLLEVSLSTIIVTLALYFVPLAVLRVCIDLGWHA